MRYRVIQVLAILAVSVPLWAAPPQGARINIAEVDHLEEKADEVVSVNLDGESLALGRKFLAVSEGVAMPAKELAKGLKGIYLRKVTLTSTMGPGVKVDVNTASALHADDF